MGISQDGDESCIGICETKGQGLGLRVLGRRLRHRVPVRAKQGLRCFVSWAARDGV